MRRREFIVVLGGVAATSLAPRVARLQQRPHRVAFVHSGIPADRLTEKGGPFWVRRVHETLRALGDLEGSNLVIERYSAEGRSERFAALAAEVVSSNPDVIIVNLNDLVKAFTAATSRIPLVVITGDPIAGGLLTNLAHPGDNLTGVAINAGVEIYGKRLQLLKEAMPKTAMVAQLLSGAWTDAIGMASYLEAARSLGIQLHVKELPEVKDSDLRRSFAELAQEKFDAAIVDEGGSFLAQRALIVELAARHSIPVMYPYRDYVELGGLMAYAPDLDELAQRVASDCIRFSTAPSRATSPSTSPTSSS